MATITAIRDEIGTSVKETVESAKEYITELSDLINQLEIVENQIGRTSEKSELAIRKHFSQLSEQLTFRLNERCSQLLSEVSAVRFQAIQPLRESRNIINTKLLNAQKVQRLAEDILMSEPTSKPQLLNLCEKASLLGSLPEVPGSSNVASISVTFQDGFLDSVSSSIESHGSVNAYSQVQICFSEERPGALLLHWMQREGEENEEGESISFRLQSCPGDALERPETVSFRDQYLGEETSCLVRDLSPCALYSFRVCCQLKRGNWSSWSQPFVAMTRLPHYEWKPSKFYHLADEGRIATKTVESTSGVLLSNDTLSKGCHSIQFRILEMGITANVDEGVALLDMHRQPANQEPSFNRKGAIHINMQGAVSVDGREVSSRLPSLHKGSMVTFELEPLEVLNKVRVTVESGQRQVTYDWPLPDSPNFRFALFFRCAGWKLVVE